MKTQIILYFSLINYTYLLSQTIDPGNLFEFYEGQWQKNINVSKRIQDEWNLSNTFLQTIHYNSNLDVETPPFDFIKQVLYIYDRKNQIGDIILELLDDGNHFDNNPDDGIYGNYISDDFREFITDEAEIDIQWDTLGINYHIISNPVKYLPKVPTILGPSHKSVVNSSMLEVLWEIDELADGCGLILLLKPPVLGQELEGIIWEKEYRSLNMNYFNDKIPVKLLNDKEYTLIIWSYTHIDPNKKSHGAYSFEWSQFHVDTLQRSENFVISNNFPNPFNNYTILNYSLPYKGIVSIRIFDILGQSIADLVHEEQSAGDQYIYWNGKNNYGNDVSSGIYLYGIEFNKQIVYSKMIINR